jgi:3,4-dihydroxy 2-butanone 4-phosphate synthase/GTP cyclohydrolase II
MSFNINKALEDIKNGKPIIIVDDSDREDEGDLVLAAEMADQYNLTFCMKHGGGLMCLPCTKDRLDRLGIPMMPSNDLDPLQTPFATSIDAVEGTTTGMSVLDRLKTINVLLNENSTQSDLHYPGHLFPLRAKDGLLKERRGHTESSVEIVKLAGFKPVSMIIEIMNPDGTMTKGHQIYDFAKTYGLTVVTIQEIYDAVYNKSV